MQLPNGEHCPSRTRTRILHVTRTVIHFRTNKKNSYLPTPQTPQMTIARVALAKKSTCSMTVGRCVGVSSVIWLDLSVVVLESMIFFVLHTTLSPVIGSCGRAAAVAAWTCTRAAETLRLCGLSKPLWAPSVAAKERRVSEICGPSCNCRTRLFCVQARLATTVHPINTLPLEQQLQLPLFMQLSC